jgi:hypothetical protein
MFINKRMKQKDFLLILCVFFIRISIFPNISIHAADSIVNAGIDDLIEQAFSAGDSIAMDTDSLEPASPATVLPKVYSDTLIGTSETVIPAVQEEVKYEPLDIQQVLVEYEKKRVQPVIVPIDKRFLETNPLFIDLLFHGFSASPIQLEKTSVQHSLSKTWGKELVQGAALLNNQASYDVLQQLRDKTTRRLAADAPYLIAFHVDELPDVTDLINFQLNINPIEEFKLSPRSKSAYEHRRIVIEKVKPMRWTTRSNALLQFSQSYISPNWHQGGNDYISILGVLNGTFNYDNKKNIQWDNFGEWRMGFNSVEGDTLRILNTNDDIVRATSKLGIKASGNWYYSTSVDFSTHLFNSYNGINSTAKKVKFLTPVRFNAGIGLDYKYKKIFSLMLSPLSYKFIYANDTVEINQNSFGILTGEKTLNQIGSSFRAQLSYSPIRELQIDSKFYFYTNYEKIEVDWEIVGDFKFNRYLSTRLSINPRYDNTVFLAAGEKAKIQFKELLTFGLSYRLL